MRDEQEEKSDTHKLKNPEGLQEALNQLNQSWTGLVLVVEGSVCVAFEGLKKALEIAGSAADLNQAWENDMHELQKLAKKLEKKRPNLEDMVLKIEPRDDFDIEKIYPENKRKGKGKRRKWESPNKFHS